VVRIVVGIGAFSIVGCGWVGWVWRIATVIGVAVVKVTVWVVRALIVVYGIAVY
jgi:hypothetical protein